MRNLAIVLALLLAGCDSTGALTPQGKTALSIACGVDAIAVPLATDGAKAAAIVDPTIAPEVAIAATADVPAHAAIQDQCAKVTKP